MDPNPLIRTRGKSDVVHQLRKNASPSDSTSTLAGTLNPASLPSFKLFLEASILHLKKVIYCLPRCSFEGRIKNIFFGFFFCCYTAMLVIFFPNKSEALILLSSSFLFPIREKLFHLPNIEEDILSNICCSQFLR